MTLLVENGVDLNTVDTHGGGHSALHNAIIHYDDTKILNYFLSTGALSYTKNVQGLNSLEISLNVKKMDALKALLHHQSV